MAASRYESASSGHSADRLQEEIRLPVFASVPATAGLSKAEAFQLSLKHALAVLPQILTMRDAAAQVETTERFALR